MPAKAKVRGVTSLVAKNSQPDVDGIVVATVVEGDGADAFVDALSQVTSYYKADLVVGWTEQYEGAEELDEEEPEEELEEEEEGEYTEDSLAELESDDLRAILEDMGIELDGRFGRQKAIAAILEEQ
jgi:hypothetical protein